MPSMPAPVAPAPAAPDKSDPEVQREEQEARLRAARAKGHSSTVLTGGEGDTSAAPTEQKTLLGT
jgi:hypothetical protein